MFLNVLGFGMLNTEVTPERQFLWRNEISKILLCLKLYIHKIRFSELFLAMFFSRYSHLLWGGVVDDIPKVTDT
jgi:hypothetical protein